MLIIAIATVAGVAVLLLLLRLGLLRGVLALLLISTALIPLRLFGGEESAFHVGISAATPEVRTFTLAVLISFVAVMITGKLPSIWLYLPLLLWLLLNWILVWPQSDLRLSGLLQYVVGVAAWGVAVTVGKCRNDAPTHRVIVYLVFAVVFANTMVAVAQFVGVPINVLSSADSSILGSRVNGLSNHPNNLGKTLLLLSILVIPFTESGDRRVARLATASIAMSFLPLALAQGRTNLAAIAALVLIWVLLSPRLRISRKIGVLMGLSVAGLLASGVVIARFEEDPEGGVRGTIIEYAYAMIARYPWSGTGPNAYSFANSPLTGSYIPVHNSFLLSAAEIGVPGALLLLLPILVVVTVAWNRRRAATVGSYARAIVAGSLPIALVAYTGWGMLGTSVFALAMIVFGYLWGAMNSQASNVNLALPQRRAVTTSL